MKKKLFFCLLIIFSSAKIIAVNHNKAISIAYATEYETSVTFPAGYAIGDYVEFLRVNPTSAGASGYYQISLSYTKGNIASAATHIASISHSNPNLWRETGRINNNPYVGSGTNAGADFVFEKDYNLPSLDSIDKFIQENKHLPEIASAEEMKKDGINLSEMNIKLLQKIEEMTLYMIEQNKKINELQKQNKNFENIEARLKKIEDNIKP